MMSDYLIDAYVGLGSNLGESRLLLLDAILHLSRTPGCSLIERSHFYRSTPWQATGPDYLNAVVRMRTALTPLTLLDHLQAIEQQFGRERLYPNAPRTLDLDLLLYGQPDAWLTMIHDRLLLPHPRMHLRAFVLQPLLELTPQLTLGSLGNAACLLPALHDQDVQRIPEPLLGMEGANLP